MSAHAALHFTSLPELQRLGKPTGASLSVEGGGETGQSQSDYWNAIHDTREVFNWERKQPWSQSTRPHLIKHSVDRDTVWEMLALPAIMQCFWIVCVFVRGQHTLKGVMCFNWTVRVSSSSLTLTMAGWKTLLGSSISTWNQPDELVIVYRTVLPYLLLRWCVSSYWAAICGDGGFTGLQQQLHPEVCCVLFWRFHLGKFGKLTVENVRLHDGGDIPERHMSNLITNIKIIWDWD